MPKQAATTDNRRRFSRVPFEASVSLMSGPHKWMGKLLDVSLKGLLVTHPHQWTAKVGDKLVVEVHPPEEPFIISMHAVVAHVHDDRVGLQCTHIDIDSISHLRRLVELNLGNDSILNRELAALGAH